MSAAPAATKPTFDIVAVGRELREASRARRAASIAAGIALGALGHSIRGAVGGALALGGLLLFAYGITGHSPRAAAKVVAQKLGTRSDDDRVDQASWESFPASDPPAHSPPKR